MTLSLPFDPDRRSVRVNYVADCPAALVAEVCGQLVGGVTDIDVLGQSLYSGGLCDSPYEGREYSKAILRMLVALGFLKAVPLAHQYEFTSPIALDESFSQYFEERSEDDDY